MSRYFLGGVAIVAALAAACFAGVDLAAKCRCDRQVSRTTVKHGGGHAARREARQQSRCERRGRCAAGYVAIDPSNTTVDPNSGGQVQILGITPKQASTTAGETSTTESYWECRGGRCYLRTRKRSVERSAVGVPVTPLPVPSPDPEFKDVKPDVKPDASTPDTSTTPGKDPSSSLPLVDPDGDASEFHPDPVASSTWRPDIPAVTPQTIHFATHSDIPSPSN